jgi:hypothetical protein
VKLEGNIETTISLSTNPFSFHTSEKTAWCCYLEAEAESRRMRWAGHVARMGGRGMHIGYWWENQKETLGRPRCRWVDNIKMDLREIGWNGVYWIDVA